jgi:hypothetical protein
MLVAFLPGRFDISHARIDLAMGGFAQTRDCRRSFVSRTVKQQADGGAKNQREEFERDNMVDEEEFFV